MKFNEIVLFLGLSFVATPALAQHEYRAVRCDTFTDTGPIVNRNGNIFFTRLGHGHYDWGGSLRLKEVSEHAEGVTFPWVSGSTYVHCEMAKLNQTGNGVGMFELVIKAETIGDIVHTRHDSQGFSPEKSYKQAGKIRFRIYAEPEFLEGEFLDGTHLDVHVSKNGMGYASQVFDVDGQPGEARRNQEFQRMKDFIRALADRYQAQKILSAYQGLFPDFMRENPAFDQSFLHDYRDISENRFDFYRKNPSSYRFHVRNMVGSLLTHGVDHYGDERVKVSPPSSLNQNLRKQLVEAIKSVRETHSAPRTSLEEKKLAFDVETAVGEVLIRHMLREFPQATPGQNGDEFPEIGDANSKIAEIKEFRFLRDAAEIPDLDISLEKQTLLFPENSTDSVWSLMPSWADMKDSALFEQSQINYSPLQKEIRSLIRRYLVLPVRQDRSIRPVMACLHPTALPSFLNPILKLMEQEKDAKIPSLTTLAARVLSDYKYHVLSDSPKWNEPVTQSSPARPDIAAELKSRNK